MSKAGLSAFASGTGVRAIGVAMEVILGAAMAFALVRAIMLFAAPQSIWTDQDKKFSVFAVTTDAPESGQHFNFSFDPFHPAFTSLAVEHQAPDTALDLQLFGIRSGVGGGAIIQTPDNAQHTYKTGDEIIDGVRLRAIKTNYVVLSQNGRLERLAFDKASGQGLPVSTARLAEGLDAQSFLTAVTLTRAIKDGRTIGYEIRPRNTAVSLGQFGLQNGDILTAIGEEDLTLGRPEFGLLFAELNSAHSISISIIRNGHPVTVKMGK